MLSRLQRLVLGLIVSIVWFDILCFILILISSVFKWSFLSETFSTGFFTAFGVSLGGLVALGILHLTISLNLLSSSIQEIALSKAPTRQLSTTTTQKDAQLFKLGLVSAIGGIAVIVLMFWFGEFRVNRHRLQVTMNQLAAIAQSPLSDKAAELIAQDVALKELLQVRDAMHASLEDKRGLSIIFPMTKMGMPVHYELTPWWALQEDTVISKADLRVFVPYENEKVGFQEFLRSHKPFSSFTRSSLRVFYPIVRENKLIFILLFDTSRQASDAYLLKRSVSR